VHGVLDQPDQPAIVCVTVCTKTRKHWLVNAVVHDLLRTVWMNAIAWAVGRYTIMPDHIHLFAGEHGSIPLDNWVRYWKSQFSKRHGNPNHRWQTDHWDRRMRSAAEYEDTWNYVFWNPVRAGLVESPNQWPWSGELHDLRWD
jgi:putative transposase